MLTPHWLKKSIQGDASFPALFTGSVINLLIVNTALAIVIFSILALFQPADPARIIGSLVFTLVWASLFLILRRGHVRLTQTLMIGFTFSITVLTVASSGGLGSPHMVSMLVPIFMGTFFFEIRGMLVMFCLVLAGYISLSMLNLPSFSGTVQEYVTIQATTFLSNVLYLYFAYRWFNHELKHNRQLNLKLRESEAHLKKLVMELPTGAMVVSFSGKINLINQQLTRMSGYDPEEITTLDEWYDRLHPQPERRQELINFWSANRLSEDREVVDTESEIYTRSGERVDLEVKAAMLGEEIVVLMSDITERKKAEAEIARKVNQISSLRVLDIAIMNSNRLTELLNVFVEQIAAQLSVDAVWVVLRDRSNGQLLNGFSHGFAEAPLIESLSSQDLFKNDPQRLSPALYRDVNSIVKSFGAHGVFFSCAATIPLNTINGNLGFLNVFCRHTFNPDEDWLRFFEAIAGQTAIGIERIHLIESLQEVNYSLAEAYDTTLEGWARALELRDKETEGHSRRVAEMTICLAREIGIPESHMDDIYRGALLHDIGKMPIPDQILLKNGPLNEEEWRIMQQHPQTAYHLLKNIPFLRCAIEIPYSHHEHWDGSGYPQGLSGEQIPVSARVFAIADVWDALRSDRPYREAWSEERAMTYILEKSGSQFDPQIVSAFAKMMQSKP